MSTRHSLQVIVLKEKPLAHHPQLPFIVHCLDAEEKAEGCQLRERTLYQDDMVADIDLEDCRCLAQGYESRPNEPLRRGFGDLAGQVVFIPLYKGGRESSRLGKRSTHGKNKRPTKGMLATERETARK